MGECIIAEIEFSRVSSVASSLKLSFGVTHHPAFSRHDHHVLALRQHIMDDIADILASVSGGPLIPQAILDLQALTRAWVNERTAPELLPYPADLVDRTMERVAKQVRCTSLAGV